MSKLKHTPGPWKHTKGHIGAKIADFVSCNGKTMDGMHIHNGEKRFGHSSEESEANARLIAAAPEMLEMLINQIKSSMRRTGFTAKETGELTSHYDIARLIEKATGKLIEEVFKDE